MKQRGIFTIINQMMQAQALKLEVIIGNLKTSITWLSMLLGIWYQVPNLQFPVKCSKILRLNDQFSVESLKDAQSPQKCAKRWITVIIMEHVKQVSVNALRTTQALTVLYKLKWFIKRKSLLAVMNGLILRLLSLFLLKLTFREFQTLLRSWYFSSLIVYLICEHFSSNQPLDLSMISSVLTILMKSKTMSMSHFIIQDNKHKISQLKTHKAHL